MSQNLTTKTINGMKWTTSATMAGAILQVGYTSIMGHLLSPAAFGLVALANLILRFGTYFASMGMGSAIVQKKDLKENEVRAAFTSGAILGLLFFIITWFLAPLAPSLLKEDQAAFKIQIVSVVRIMAFSFILTGLSSTSFSLLKRNMNFKTTAIIDISTHLVSYLGIGVVLAYYDFGVWSLICASLSQHCLAAIAAYMVVRHNVTLIFSWTSYKPLFSYGSRISFISFIDFLGANLDTMLIGRLLGANMLGYYNRAYMLVNLPIQNLTLSMSKVLFPAFSKLQGETSKLKEVYLSAISFAGFIIAPICIGISVSAEQIVLVVLGEKWRPAIVILQILSLATPFKVLLHFSGIICDATATLKPKAILQIVYLIGLFMLFYLFSPYGAEGIAYAIILAVFIKNIAYIFITKSILHFKIKEILLAYRPAIFSASITFFSINAFLLLTSKIAIPQLVLLLAEMSVGAISLLISLLFLPDKTLKMKLFNKIRVGLKISNNDTFFNRFVLNTIKVFSN